MDDGALREADLTKLTVPKLRAALTDRGLDAKGVKGVLIERLSDYLESADNDGTAADGDAADAADNTVADADGEEAADGEGEGAGDAAAGGSEGADGGDVHDSTVTDLVSESQGDPEPEREFVVPARFANMDALVVHGFQRPIKESKVRQMLEEHGGELREFWMNSLKSAAVAVFASATAAQRTRSLIQNKPWPHSSSQELTAVSLVAEDALRRIAAVREAGPSDLAAAEEAAVAPRGRREKAPAAVEAAADAGSSNGGGGGGGAGDQPASAKGGAASIKERLGDKGKDKAPLAVRWPSAAEMEQDPSYFKTDAEPAVWYRPITDAQLAGSEVLPDPPQRRDLRGPSKRMRGGDRFRGGRRDRSPPRQRRRYN